jgi:hypothetical protein
VSYIAFDLDALNVAPDVGAAADLSAAEVSYGLARLWAWCFRQSKDRITVEHVAAFFGGQSKAAGAARALEAFGFLETESSGFRVKGADRYLRVREARVKGGKKAAAAGNLKRGSRRGAGTPSPAGPQLAPSSSPADSQLPPSPTPNTEHRTPNTESKSTAPREKRAPLPRETDCIGEDFEAAGLGKYAWQGAKDGTAWALLRAHSEVPEIRARWRFGLKADGWLRVATVAQLHSKWNDLGVAMKRPATAPSRDTPQTYSDGYYVEPAT